MPKITATSRLFLRAKPTRDPEGNLLYSFVEAKPNRAGYVGLTVQGRLWEINVSLGGVRYGRLKQKDRHGAWHIRALRRIEEDHLMKFAIHPNIA